MVLWPKPGCFSHSWVTHMPRFFFDFRQGKDRTPDTTGLVLANVEAAYLEAFKGAHDIWSELLKERLDPRRCTLEVRSEAGEDLFVLPFSELLDSCVDRTARPRASFGEILATTSYARRVSKEFASEIQATRQILKESHSLRRWANDIAGR